MSRLILILLLIHGVFTDDCIKYNFENDYEELFVRHNFPCAYEGIIYYEPWSYLAYNGTTIPPPNAKSKRFISPSASDISCVSSFPFTVSPGGAVEVNVYISTKSPSEFVTVEVHEINEVYESQPVAGISSLSDAEPGWHVLKVENLIGECEDKPFQGYVTFWGGSEYNSIVIVDSFRYIPPLY